MPSEPFVMSWESGTMLNTTGEVDRVVGEDRAAPNALAKANAGEAKRSELGAPCRSRVPQSSMNGARWNRSSPRFKGPCRSTLFERLVSANPFRRPAYDAWGRMPPLRPRVRGWVMMSAPATQAHKRIEQIVLEGRITVRCGNGETTVGRIVATARSTRFGPGPRARRGFSGIFRW